MESHMSDCKHNWTTMGLCTECDESAMWLVKELEEKLTGTKKERDVLESALQKILWQGADSDENHEIRLMHDSEQMAEIARKGLDCLFPNTRSRK